MTDNEKKFIKKSREANECGDPFYKEMRDLLDKRDSDRMKAVPNKWTAIAKERNK